jgi:hypothetical protein
MKERGIEYLLAGVFGVALAVGLLMVGIALTSDASRTISERSQCMKQCQEIHKLCQKACPKGDGACHQQCARAAQECRRACRGATQPPSLERR